MHCKAAATQSATYAMFAIRTEKIYPFIDNVTGHKEFRTQRCVWPVSVNKMRYFYIRIAKIAYVACVAYVALCVACPFVNRL
jgi:hypothetical protein